MKAYLSITQDFLVNFTEWFYNVLIRISIIFRKWRERWQENYIYVQADPHFILGLKPSGTKKQVVIPTLGELQWKYPFIYTFPLCL